MQAISNYNNKSTGQLSGVTCWMLFLGSVARVFTSIQETGDITTIVIYLITTTLNGLILAQLLYYGAPATKKVKKQ